MPMWVQIATLGLFPLGLVLGFAAGRITAREFADHEDDEEYGIAPIDGWGEDAAHGRHDPAAVVVGEEPR